MLSLIMKEPKSFSCSGERGMKYHWGFFKLERMEDCSMYKPRGHYNSSAPLRRYFQAMMWCGNMDVRFNPKFMQENFQQMKIAATLTLLIVNSGKLFLFINKFKFYRCF
jgi:hypothetical protein